MWHHQHGAWGNSTHPSSFPYLLPCTHWPSYLWLKSNCSWDLGPFRDEGNYSEEQGRYSAHTDGEPNFPAFCCAQLFPYCLSEVQEVSLGLFLGISQILKEDSKVRQGVPFWECNVFWETFGQYRIEAGGGEDQDGEKPCKGVARAAALESDLN